MDKPQEPSLKGLINFTRGYTDEDRQRIRMNALNCDKEKIQEVVEKHVMSLIEDGKTCRVVFGNQNENLEKLAE